MNSKTPTETLEELAAERGVTLGRPDNTSGAWVDVYRQGQFLTRCANVVEATGFIRQLYTPAEYAHYQNVNRKTK